MSAEDMKHRFAFHPATTDEKRAKHAAVRERSRALADYLDSILPDGREKALALTNLEQVMFWSNAALARER